MKKTSFLILGIIFSLILILGCTQQDDNPSTNEPKVVTAKLMLVEGGNFSSFSNYYEGRLTLLNTITGESYSIFTCSDSWDWVKKDSCYRFDINGVNKKIESNKYSAELSGCYVGSLEEVSC